MSSQQSFHSTSVANVTIESVVSLSNTQIDTILTNLGLDKATVTVNNVQNQALIAGLRVIVAGKIIDLSFQHALDQL